LENYQFLVILAKLTNMGRNTSISLGDHFEDFVDAKVSSGRFKNASEVLRAGLRLLEAEEIKILALQKAIAEGIESGVARNFDPKKHLEKLKAAKRKNG
jgi:antitoxin ParD1/3/4